MSLHPPRAPFDHELEAGLLESLRSRREVERVPLRILPAEEAVDLSDEFFHEIASATARATSYDDFVRTKTHSDSGDGFAASFLPDFLFDFQRALVEWSCRRGRAALLADCGLGKTPMQLVWAQNVVERTNGRVLVLTPLAVGHQTVAEAEKFHIEAARSTAGELRGKIIVANYERLHYFDRHDFVGLVADESSILKNCDGKTKAAVTDFARQLPYRLLATATAAPNDYTELGTSSEALGELGFVDMLNRFFKNDLNNSSVGRGYLGKENQWRFKGHAEVPFWRWVCSWARALRKPSDLGFSDEGFSLPPLIQKEHVVQPRTQPDGRLFPAVALSLDEQREERRSTIRERCERVAELVSGTGEQAMVWCHLNAEGDLLAELIDDAQQVSGDNDEVKEERLLAFQRGELRTLITKPKIGAWGLNLQRCAHTTAFPSHSYEQHYQMVRRLWRYGQKRPVRVDMVMTEGERAVVDNQQRKAAAAERMFSALVQQMNSAAALGRDNSFVHQEQVPAWL